jgi:hypothetical protein
MKLKLYFLKITRYNDGVSGVIIPIGKSNPPLCKMEVEVKNGKDADEYIKKMEEHLRALKMESGEYRLMSFPIGRKFSGFNKWDENRQRDFLIA